MSAVSIKLLHDMTLFGFCKICVPNYFTIQTLSILTKNIFFSLNSFQMKLFLTLKLDAFIIQKRDDQTIHCLSR